MNPEQQPQMPVTPEPISPYNTGQDPHFPVNHPVPDGSKPVSNDPGKVLGLISFIGIFFGFGLISVILGIIGLKKSKQAGHRNGFALAGIILGILEIIAGIIIAVLFVMFAFTAVDVCSELGTGSHTLVNGTTVNCNI